jgi:hypothetical protein
MLAASPLHHCWLAEIIRLREARWGPLDDTDAVRQARHAGGSFQQRLLTRARVLGEREQLSQVLNQWHSLARVALLLLALAALFTGAATAAGALGDGSRSVNSILALVALLGLPTLTLLLWLLSAFMQPGQTSGLAQAGLWISNKLARGPNASLAPAALLELTQQRRSTRALSGVVSHSLWLLALLAGVVTLVALLSARRYNFNWETTLLSPEAFVAITHGLGVLPGLLGFSTPSEAIIRASDGLQTLPDSANALWSGWLIGCVVVYGILPRLVLLVLNVAIARKRMGHCLPDPALPGFAELHDRLMPASTPAGIDAPAPPLFTPQKGLQDHADTLAGSAAIVGLELPHELAWPPFELPDGVANLGNIDGRSERHAVLDRLYADHPAHLMIVCDASQTPDRGTLAFLAELAKPVTGRGHFLLLQSTSRGERLTTWQHMLKQAGFNKDNVHTHPQQARNWLATVVTPQATHKGSPTP